MSRILYLHVHAYAASPSPKIYYYKVDPDVDNIGAQDSIENVHISRMIREDILGRTCKITRIFEYPILCVTPNSTCLLGLHTKHSAIPPDTWKLYSRTTLEEAKFLELQRTLQNINL